MSSSKEFHRTVLIALGCFGGFVLLLFAMLMIERFSGLPSPARQVKQSEPPPPWVQRMAGVPENRIQHPSRNVSEYDDHDFGAQTSPR